MLRLRSVGAPCCTVVWWVVDGDAGVAAIPSPAAVIELPPYRVVRPTVLSRTTRRAGANPRRAYLVVGGGQHRKGRGDRHAHSDGSRQRGDAEQTPEFHGVSCCVGCFVSPKAQPKMDQALRCAFIRRDFQSLPLTMPRLTP